LDVSLVDDAVLLRRPTVLLLPVDLVAEVAFRRGVLGRAVAESAASRWRRAPPETDLLLPRLGPSLDIFWGRYATPPRAATRRGPLRYPAERAPAAAWNGMA